MEEINFNEVMFADLHIHSRFSRACSKNINFENLVKWARIKGLNLLGTGDFTHPIWIKEIKEQLEDRDTGFYYLDDFPFVITGEVSLIYTQDRGRRVHLVLLVPSVEVAEKINSYLDTKGRRDYDGRPIFKISCEVFVKDMRAISEDIEVIPAHCLPGDSMVHVNHSLKKIKDINVGDLVYTHNNNWKKVKEIFFRKYSGKLYKIKPWCWTEGLETTSEHPFYAIRSYKCSWIKGLCKKSCSKSNSCENRRFEKYLREWVPASELKQGDFLVYPRFNIISDTEELNLTKFIKNCRLFKKDYLLHENSRNFRGKVKKKIKVNKNFCRLAGYYLAEGYRIRDEGIGFSFNSKEEKYIEDVVDLMKEVFGTNKFKIDSRKNGQKDVIFFSKLVNCFFKQFYNSKICRAHTKYFPKFILELPLFKQVELFKGWYRGDKGYTTSKELLNQMKIICLRLAIVPNINTTKEKHKERGKHFISGRKIIANHDLYSLGNLSFFEDKFRLLNEVEFKRFKTKLNRKHGWLDKDYIYLPIRKIETRNYFDYVYNLEVEEDNSYVSQFACVHNCWTPWFGVFGSASGFDSLKECFGKQFNNIHAIETGISSDPLMNWKIKELEGKSIVSFSDSHSFWPYRLGREATIFHKCDSYTDLIKQVRKNEFVGTIETDPAYGKYHFDGHRACDFSCSPEKTKELGGMCPKCGRKLVIGVDNRVESLANGTGKDYEKKKMFYTILPLHEIISLNVGVSMNSKRVWGVYDNLIEKFENEFNVLLKVSMEEFINFGVDEKLIELILRNREGRIKVKPGFDGLYGVALLEDSKEEQKTLD